MTPFFQKKSKKRTFLCFLSFLKNFVKTVKTRFFIGNNEIFGFRHPFFRIFPNFWILQIFKFYNFCHFLSKYNFQKIFLKRCPKFFKNQKTACSFFKKLIIDDFNLKNFLSKVRIF